MGKNQDWGSGIWDKHPGSSTLIKAIQQNNILKIKSKIYIFFANL
jgi:hypothetical protein